MQSGDSMLSPSPPTARRSPLVNISPMANLLDKNNTQVFIDTVNGPIIAHTKFERAN